MKLFLRAITVVVILSMSASCIDQLAIERQVDDMFAMTFDVVFPIGGSLVWYQRETESWPEDVTELCRFLAKRHERSEFSGVRWVEWARRTDGSLEVFGRIRSGRDFRFGVTRSGELKTCPRDGGAGEVILEFGAVLDGQPEVQRH